jgi:hypothetical protein
MAAAASATKVDSIVGAKVKVSALCVTWPAAHRGGEVGVRERERERESERERERERESESESERKRE